MINQVNCYIKPYIQPFERYLAIQELMQVAGAMPTVTEDSHIYLVSTSRPLDHIAKSLTYWERVQFVEQADNGLITDQLRHEATVKIAGDGIVLDDLENNLPYQSVPIPKRRMLRYGSHGIHEYRGKFFPQLVRSLLNIADLKPDATVLDPMCGSGTTLVEANLMGFDAVGVDMNPLSILVSQTKRDLLTVNPNKFRFAYKQLVERIDSSQLSNKWFSSLPEKDQIYLERWFSSHVLNELDRIMTSICVEKNTIYRNLFLVNLSNILRRVSWQKNDDLRVRKAVTNTDNLDVCQIYADSLHRTVKTVLAFLYETNGTKLGHADVHHGDARKINQLNFHVGSIDVILTSPPYATALPYLDTDRLSLSYLQLLSRPEHRQRDYDMIGNREIGKRQKEQYWQNYIESRHLLPDSICQMIDRIDTLNRNGEVGFRRKNRATLLSRYFFDMRKVLLRCQQLLAKNAPAYFVVGNNHTIAGGSSESEGGERIEIQTDHLLAELGESIGFKLTESISMEMLTSRDIFRKNTGSSESILCFRN